MSGLPADAPLNSGEAFARVNAVTHPTIDRRIVLVWCPGETPPAARAFITVAREQLG